MGMIQAMYFQNTPAHKLPKRAVAAGSDNRGIKGSAKDRSGRYALANEAQHYFKRKVLPKLEAARKRGDMVRFSNNTWTINGEPV